MLHGVLKVVVRFQLTVYWLIDPPVYPHNLGTIYPALSLGKKLPESSGVPVLLSTVYPSFDICGSHSHCSSYRIMTKSLLQILLCIHGVWKQSTPLYLSPSPSLCHLRKTRKLRPRPFLSNWPRIILPSNCVRIFE